MAIIMELSKNEFADAFRNMGREDQFSYDALNALYDHYSEAYLCDTDEDFKLDVIAICCDWTEYEEDELIEQYGETDRTELDEVIEYCDSNGQVITVSNGYSYLVQNF